MLEQLKRSEQAMRLQAKPGVAVSTRLSIETEELRRRLQQRTGYSFPKLIDEGLRCLEDRLQSQEVAA